MSTGTCFVSGMGRSACSSWCVARAARTWWRRSQPREYPRIGRYGSRWLYSNR